MKITLRAFSESDASRLIGWMTSADLLIQWAGPSQFTFPLTEIQLKHYMDGAKGEQPTRRIFTATIEDGCVAGHIELGAINRENRTATVCRVFISPHVRGKGYCHPMVHEALKIGFEELDLRRIELRVYSFNKAAIQCYLKAGFVKEGLLRKSQKVGDHFWDTVLMAILVEEWIQMRPDAEPVLSSPARIE